jgi:RNA polymerase sigma-70 factor (ECF subfamily)
MSTIGGPSQDDYAGLRQRLAAAVRRVCPPWLAARAEDIVQAALMRALDVARRGEGQRLLVTSYIWRVAYSAVVDEIRRQRRLHEVPMDELTHEVTADAAPDPERATRGREIGAAITDCLQRLVRARRHAVTLHLLGHTVAEAGRLLGWSAKRAENLVYRGLADLRACLAAKGLQP